MKKHYSLSRITPRGGSRCESKYEPRGGTLLKGFERNQTLFSQFHFPRPSLVSVREHSCRGLLVTAMVFLSACAVNPYRDMETLTVSAEFESELYLTQNRISQANNTSENLQDLQYGEEVEVQNGSDLNNLQLDEPMRLVMTGVTSDVLMRRLAESTNIEWLAETDILLSSSFDVDVVIRDTDELYSLIDALASASGARTRWDGRRVAFVKEGGGTRGQTDGYLVRAAVRSEDLIAVVQERYGVICTNINTLAVCVGPRSELTAVKNMLASLEGQYGRIAWRLVTTTSPIDTLINALGLTSEVTFVELSPARYLIASSSSRMLSVVIEALNTASESGCEPFVYQPEHLDALEVQEGVIALSVPFCSPPVVVAGAIYASVDRSLLPRTRAAMLLADRPRPMASMTIYVANASDNRRAGIETTGWDGLIPSSNPIDAVSLSLVLQRLSGWRMLSFSTDGSSETAIQQTDRVDGEVIVTDGGSQIVGVDERRTGLTVGSTGSITSLGFRGRISISDSTLAEDIVSSATCEGYVTVNVGEVAKVCEYTRTSNSRGVRLIGLEGSKSAEKFMVYVAVRTAERAGVETLRLGEQS